MLFLKTSGKCGARPSDKHSVLLISEKVQVLGLELKFESLGTVWKRRKVSSCPNPCQHWEMAVYAGCRV